MKAARMSTAAGAALFLAFAVGLSAQSPIIKSVPKAETKGIPVPQHAAGPFDVKVVPLPPDDKVGDPSIARMSLDKQFHGDLEATSKGLMLAMGDAKTSAGYVAMERVSGTLHGRKGTFALQHTGTMTRGVASLSVTVVPDSGTEELTGIAGKLDIKIAEGKHSYDFEYTLPAQ